MMNRAERRRREKDDRQAISRGLNVAARNAPQAASLMRVLHTLVCEARQSRRLQPVLSFLYGNLDLTRSQAPHDMVACRKGCSHCCKMWVSATAPEIFFIAAAVRSRLLNMDGIFAAIDRTKGMDFDARGAFIAACPLLGEDDTCSIYESRPLACRTATSMDAEVCRRGYLELSGEDIPQSMFFLLQRASYAVTMRGAFKQAGLPLVSYELNEALAAALTEDDAEGRWLAGENIFAGIRRDPNGDPMDAPYNRQLVEFAFSDGR